LENGKIDFELLRKFYVHHTLAVHRRNGRWKKLKIVVDVNAKIYVVRHDGVFDYAGENFKRAIEIYNNIHIT